MRLPLPAVAIALVLTLCACSASALTLAEAPVDAVSNVDQDEVLLLAPSRAFVVSTTNATASLTSSTTLSTSTQATALVRDPTVAHTRAWFVDYDSPSYVGRLDAQADPADLLLSNFQRPNGNTIDRAEVVTGEFANDASLFMGENHGGTSEFLPVSISGVPTGGTGGNFGNEDMACGVAADGVQWWGMATNPGKIIKTELSGTTQSETAEATFAAGIGPVTACVRVAGNIYLTVSGTPGSVVRVHGASLNITATRTHSARGGFSRIFHHASEDQLWVTTNESPAYLIRMDRAAMAFLADDSLGVNAPSVTAITREGLIVVTGTEATPFRAPVIPPPPPPPCADLLECATCTGNRTDSHPCAWCTGTGTCVNGDANGACATDTLTLATQCNAPTPGSGGSNNTGLAVGLTFFFLFLIAAAIGGGYLWYRHTQQQSVPYEKPVESTPPPTPAQSASRIDPVVPGPKTPAPAAPAPPAPAARTYARGDADAVAASRAGAPAAPAAAALTTWGDEDDFDPTPAPVPGETGDDPAQIVGYDNPFFQVEDEQMPADGFATPPLVTDCVAWLMEKGLNEEGLFRIPGNITHMTDLLSRYEAGEDGVLAAERDEHNVAGLLKLFFRKYVGPNYLPRQYAVRLAEASEIMDEKTRIAAMRSVLSAISPGRFEMISELVALFVAVSDNYKVNKMKVSNMAKVFAPTFFKDLSIGEANSIMAVWIRNYAEIFTSPDYPEFP